MRCEVCGGPIREKPRKVMIEGAKMLVCEKCAKLGSMYLEKEDKTSKLPQISVKGPKETSRATILPSKRKAVRPPEDLEIREGFGSLIRKAREERGLSYEDLGRKIGEKVSVLKKIEGEKMIPDQKLAMKIGHVLKVKLLVQSEEHGTLEGTLSPPSSELTLGEIAQLKIGKRRRLENEGDNSSSKASI